MTGRIRLFFIHISIRMATLTAFYPFQFCGKILTLSYSMSIRLLTQPVRRGCGTAGTVTSEDLNEEVALVVLVGVVVNA